MPRGGRVRSRLTGSEEGKRSRWGEALRRAEGLLVCPLGATRNVSADLLACSTRRLTRAGGGESEERGRTVVAVGTRVAHLFIASDLCLKRFTAFWMLES